MTTWSSVILKYIVAVAEQRTFTAAALSVPVAQSALSRQIAEIEEIYNIQIFSECEVVPAQV